MTIERNAWAYALRTLRRLDNQGYNVFAGFDNVEEIIDYIHTISLGSYERGMIVKRRTAEII